MLELAPRSSRSEPDGAAAELKALQHLRLAMVGSVDQGAVQRRIVTALTAGLGFDSAFAGVLDPGQTSVGEWVSAGRSGRPGRPRLDAVSLGAGVLETAFARPGRAVLGRLGGRELLAVALQYRNQPVGVLGVAPPPEELRVVRVRSLERFAVHAAEALAGVRLCVDRAQRLAVEAERVRISVEMHDAVIQSLFAISQSLAGCAGLVERTDPRALGEVERVQALAAKTLDQLRRSIYDIWPGELLERQFVAELREYAADLAPFADSVELKIEVSGHLGAISAPVRRTLFRLAQEAVNNVFKHSGATVCQVLVDASGDPVRVTVVDDGRGMPGAVPTGSIGIAGMRSRLSALSGRLEIHSHPEHGTIVDASIPRGSACG